ncbi:hypothetical protein RHGRI_005844 [Rhododendron griersonianum]|uniref:General transcription factor 3C polypeptide 3 n=1 Tax=Rhododendron griersonianum TaxID=479676 RepID=A0AAV6LER9_9ERIC|nr:hypothetical protein RHGRI_005844 [Rhododendron griersonianum]
MGESNSFSNLNSIDTRERVSDDSRMELVQDDQEQKEGDEDGNGEYEDETEDEEEDGDGAYAFRFEGEMDPLAFPEDDTFGVQPYQQFERLEHEYGALAERKRKSLSHHHLLPPRESPVNKSRQEGFYGASMEEIMEVMNYGRRKKSRKSRKRGRRKGSKNKLNPEVTRKLGDATLHYAHGRYEEAICVLKEVIRVAPNLPDPYHTLGLIYRKIGDKKKALNFYMLAAHLTPNDSSLWKLLVTWSIEQGNAVQARYCLWKAITADPADMSLRFSRASLYVELGEYQKAAESYEQISRLCPENVEALKTATMFYQKCGQQERSVSILEDYLKSHPSDADLGVVDLLASTCMNNSAHTKALQHIEHAHRVYCAGKELPLYLSIRAGICHVHLGDDKKAESIFSVLQWENVYEHPHLVREVADSLMTLGHYKYALKYYMMLEGIGEDMQQAMRDPPLPNLLKDEEHHHLIIDLCKLLASLKRYWEAIEVINLTLKLASKTLSVEKREELQSLGAQIAYNINDPSHGWDYAQHIVNQNPYSFAAWNCYYKVVSRLGNRQHQAAAREYLEAFKLMPDSPLVNLCVGTALINLALGLRLQNKHRCLLQGLAFLYNNLRLCESSQEALYNIARAYHHLGLVTLAAAYYEKVLAIHEKDYPIPKLPNENPDGMDNQKKNYCDLVREAAYNLHLIYKSSGALDLAGQVL